MFSSQQNNVLLERVIDFCKKNSNIIEKKPSNTMFDKMLWAMYYELYDKLLIDDVYAIRVYQTLGIDKEKLIEFQNLGSKTIESYEIMLNLYGLSLNDVLSYDEIIKFSNDKVKKM